MGVRNKITVVGAGNVGATAAHWLAAKELGDVLLVDIVEGVPQGKALDLAQARHRRFTTCDSEGLNNYEGTENSYVVIITAGLAAQAGNEPRRLVEDQCRDCLRSCGRSCQPFT